MGIESGAASRRAAPVQAAATTAPDVFKKVLREEGVIGSPLKYRRTISGLGFCGVISLIVRCVGEAFAIVRSCQGYRLTSSTKVAVSGLTCTLCSHFSTVGGLTRNISAQTAREALNF